MCRNFGEEVMHWLWKWKGIHIDIGNAKSNDINIDPLEWDHLCDITYLNLKYGKPKCGSLKGVYKWMFYVCVWLNECIYMHVCEWLIVWM